MKNVLKRLLKVFLFIIGLPIIAGIILKPNLPKASEEENDTYVINFPFTVRLRDSTGIYEYMPEDIIPYMVSALAPWDILSEFDDTINPTAKRQEYLKALSIVCRTNLIYAWEQQDSPESFDLQNSGLYIKIRGNTPSQFDEAVMAVKATYGAVITNVDSEKGAVIAAPFYTTSDWDMMMESAGDGDGLSINYAAKLAKEGKDFNAILNYFYKNMQITIFDVN